MEHNRLIHCFPTYNLASFLSRILKAVSGKTDSFVEESWNFKNCLKNQKIPSSPSMNSLDVVSMFNNIPLDLAMNVEEKLSLKRNLTKIKKMKF